MKFSLCFCRTFVENNTQMKPTLVFVDDNEMMRTFLKMYYKEAYQPVVFADAKEAYEWLLEGHDAQIIVADLKMPEFSGLDFLKKIKQNRLIQHIPFLILSGEEESKDRIACLEAGAADYVVKPFHPKELELRIQRFLS